MWNAISYNKPAIIKAFHEEKIILLLFAPLHKERPKHHEHKEGPRSDTRHLWHHW